MTDELIIDGKKFRGPCVPYREFLWTGRGGGEQTKYAYPQDFPIEHFRHNVSLPRLNARTGKASVTANGDFVYALKETNKTVSNFDFLKANGITKDSLPHEWFNLFVLQFMKKNTALGFSIGDRCKFMSLKASLSNAPVHSWWINVAYFFVHAPGIEFLSASGDKTEDTEWGPGIRK